MARVMQGDAYSIPVTIKAGNGTLITPEIAACVEITVGQYTKRWPGQVAFDEKAGEWKFPVTQGQTFRFTPGIAAVQARVVFQDGSIMGGSGAPIRVEQSASRGVLPQPESTATEARIAPKSAEVTIPTVHDINVSLHSQVILSNPIKAPYIGDNGNWYEYDAATGAFVDTGVKAGGNALPPGGTTGQVLAKKSNQDGDTEWEDPQKAVLYDQTQELTEEQEQQARENIGLGEVDNTSDADKPVSTAQKEAIDGVKKALDEYETNVANGTVVPARATGDASGNNIAGTYATKQELADISAVQIRNKDEVINATQETVQTVATAYIVNNYDRQPENLDGLILTITDLDNDKILYIFSEVSNLWINAGINGVDLSNYVGVAAQTFTDAEKKQARQNIGAGTSDFGGSYNDLTDKPEPYKLPIASAEQLGGVKPSQKTDEMTQEVGVDADGKLYTAPSGGSGTDVSLSITGATVGQIAKITAVDADGKPTAWEGADAGSVPTDTVEGTLAEPVSATILVATAADAGKFLGVNSSGAFALMAIPASGGG